MGLIWLVERECYKHNQNRLIEAIENNGLKWIEWKDSFWNFPKKFENQPMIFHGSLETACRLSQIPSFKPGSFCNDRAFDCKTYYNFLQKYLLNDTWNFISLVEFVNNPDIYLSKLGIKDKFFARPTSCLKHFSGRILNRQNLSFESFDYGYYYDNPNIDILLNPVKKVLEEYRFIVVDNQVITGCQYSSENREGLNIKPEKYIYDYINGVVNNIEAPESLYVMDVCNTPEGLKVIELNPFSGADLYSCNLNKLVQILSEKFK